jgi:sulfur-carrier protein adenylyltransferase/sulfurtransferase
MSELDLLYSILDLARWAPSGDNTQPWRFEIKGEYELVVHGFDTRDHCVYDLDGHPSQMALGALLETMRIAATGHGLRTEVFRRVNTPDETPTFEVRFVPESSLRPSPLIPFITTRAVQRRPMSMRPLTIEQTTALKASVGPDYQIVAFQSLGERWNVSKLLFRNAKLRLTMPEAYHVHRSVIEWNARFSEDRIPEQAIGVDPLTAKLMRWVMQSWPRVEFFNTWLGGTIMPRIQLDLIPGMVCAAHFAVAAKVAPKSIDDYIAAGRALQRFWLEVARLGLWLQPEMTPVIFGRYHREQTNYTTNPSVQALGKQVASKFTTLLGEELVGRVVFLARVGAGCAPVARSTRIPLSRLTWTSNSHKWCN